VLGFNYGAEKSERVKTSIRFSASIAITYTAVILAVILVFPHALISLFTQEPALIAAGMRPMRIYFMMSVFMSLQIVSQQVFTALGRSKQAVFFSFLRKVFVAAPLTLLLPALGFGTDGVFIAEMISQVIGGLACGGTMYFTVYRRQGKMQ
jgi:Na+-driven multidrug efflux pump